MTVKTCQTGVAVAGVSAAAAAKPALVLRSASTRWIVNTTPAIGAPETGSVGLPVCCPVLSGLSRFSIVIEPVAEASMRVSGVAYAAAVGALSLNAPAPMAPVVTASPSTPAAAILRMLFFLTVTFVGPPCEWNVVVVV